MNSMLARVVAGLLVLVLTGPSVVAATCELTCALGSHHHDGPAPAEAPCHEHQGTSAEGVKVGATPAAFCHESGDWPSAIIEASLNTIVVSSMPMAVVVVALPPAAPTPARGYERRTLFDPRPATIPIRV